MNNNESQNANNAITAIDDLWGALHATRSLSESGPDRDAVWIALWQAITTKSERWAKPIGSSARVRITPEHADAELIAAWEWLERHENAARELAPVALFVNLRAAATGSSRGSARAANEDSMHGVTNVPIGTWLTIAGSDVLDFVA